MFGCLQTTEVMSFCWKINFGRTEYKFFGFTFRMYPEHSMFVDWETKLGRWLSNIPSFIFQWTNHICKPAWRFVLMWVVTLPAHDRRPLRWCQRQWGIKFTLRWPSLFTTSLVSTSCSHSVVFQGILEASSEVRSWVFNPWQMWGRSNQLTAGGWHDGWDFSVELRWNSTIAKASLKGRRSQTPGTGGLVIIPSQIWWVTLDQWKSNIATSLTRSG